MGDDGSNMLVVGLTIALQRNDETREFVLAAESLGALIWTWQQSSQLPRPCDATPRVDGTSTRIPGRFDPNCTCALGFSLLETISIIERTHLEASSSEGIRV